MTSRTGLISLAVVAAGALGAAGCGSSSNNDNTSSAKTVQAASTSMSGKTVSAADNGKLGKILVDSKGNTLYLFEKDTGPTSMCSGACASNWPPAQASGAPTGGDGVTASKLGTTKRSDGTEQVTYNGHPLYTYTGDGQAGQANGQGLEAFGAEWYTVSPAGSKVDKEDSGSKDSSDSSGGGGNGY
jgi:predicted lipoprotein with Yx(FWY)xxD motif